MGNFDVVSKANGIAWTAGDHAAKIVRLPILHNPSYSWGSYLTVSLANPSGAVLSSSLSTSVSLSIIDQEDNPSGQLTFIADALAATVTVRDDASVVPIRVQRCGGTLGTESCTITLSDGTATAPTDYTVPGSTTLNWADGEGGVKTLLVPLSLRTQAQGPRSFFASISMTIGNADPGFGSETITIIDHLPATAGSLGIPTTVSVRELAGNAAVVVTRTGESSGAVSVDYATSDGLVYSWSNAPAVDGTNYTAATGTLNWADGDATPRTILIPLLADGVARPALDLTLTFTNPTGGVLLPIDPGTLASFSILHLLDDDGTGGLIGLSTTQFTVDELTGQVQMSVTRSGGSTGAVSVDYTCSGGTAVAGVNYVAASGTLHWSSGDAAAKTISLTILHDNVATLDHWFGVSLTNPLGGAGLDDGNVPRNWAAVTITDTDGGSLDHLAFATTAVTVHENSGPAVVSIVRSGSGSGPAAVRLLVQAGTAQSGIDYVIPETNVVQWADGELGSKTLTIPLVYDGMPGPSRDFVVNFDVASGNAQTVAPYQAVVTILDDDAAPAGSIAFAPASLSTTSTAGTIQLTLHRSGGTTGAISVDWCTLGFAPTDARANVDFIANAGTVSWANGDSADQTIAIDLLDDALAGPPRTLVVRLANAVGGCVIGGRDAVVSISDAGPFPNGTIACVAATQTANRAAGSADIIVGRSGGSIGSVTVEYRTVDVTAVNGQDYQPTAGTLTWAAGDTSNRTISVTVLSPSGASAGDLRLDLSDSTGGAVLGQSSTLLSLLAASAPPHSHTHHCGFAGGIAGLVLLLMAVTARISRRP
jgi:Calx-beta domain